MESFPHIGSNSSYASHWIFPRICKTRSWPSKQIPCTNLAIVGTSAAIGIPLICIAIYVNRILALFNDDFKPWWRKRRGKMWSNWHLPTLRFPELQLPKWSSKGDKSVIVVSQGRGISPLPTPSQIESQNLNHISHEEVVGDKKEIISSVTG